MKRVDAEKFAKMPKGTIFTPLGHPNGNIYILMDNPDEREYLKDSNHCFCKASKAYEFIVSKDGYDILTNEKHETFELDIDMEKDIFFTIESKQMDGILDMSLFKRNRQVKNEGN